MLNEIYGFGLSAFTYIVPFIAVLSVVIFIHEMGHFLVARWCGVRVLTFSMGFGPELWHRFDRHGTRWRVAAFPLGGYVKFYGDENAASAPSHEALDKMRPAERKVSFSGQPVIKRSAIVAAGPIANFLLAIAIFAGSFYFLGRPITEARIDKVNENSAAEAAGFQANDLVVSVNGSSIDSFSEMQRIVRINPERPLQFVVKRNESEVGILATPRLQELTDTFGQTHKIGVLGIARNEGAASHKDYSVSEALVGGVKETGFVIRETLAYVGRMVTGRESAENLSGPIGIARISGQAFQLGLGTLINITAVLSVSIGLLNLFPIPLLDGGHLLYYAFEALRGRPLSEKAQEFGFKIGIAFVLCLMLFSTWNDILRLPALWPA